MKKLTKFLLLILVLVTSIFYGCRKGIQDRQSTELNNQALTEKFFSTTIALNPSVKKVYDYLKKENEKKEFANEFIKKYGFVDWRHYAIGNNSKKYVVESEGQNNTQYVELPITNESLDFAKGVLIAKLSNNNLELLVINEDKYMGFEYGKLSDQTPSSDKVAQRLIMLNAIYYNKNKFVINDKKLFDKELPLDKQLEANEVGGELSIDNPAPTQNYSTDGQITVTTTYTWYTWIIDCPYLKNGVNCPTSTVVGQCDGCKEYCKKQVKQSLAITQVFYVIDDGDWDDFIGFSGGSGGGGGGTSTGGGSNNGPTSSKPPCITKSGPLNIFNDCDNDKNGWDLFANYVDITNVWDKKFANDKAYILANTDLFEALSNFFGVDPIEEDKLTAASILVSAHKDNRINGPYDQNFFDYNVKNNLPMNLQSTTASEFWHVFKIEKGYFNNSNLNAQSLFLISIMNTIQKFRVEFDTKDQQIPYTQVNYDNTTYSKFNYTTQPWLNKPDVLPKSSFIGWKFGDNCILNAKLMMNSMGYDFSAYSAVSSTGVKQTFDCTNPSTGKVDTDETLKAISYLVEKIQQGIPVLAGVDYKPGSKNANGLTDHYIIITGMVEENGLKYFTFVETGTANLNNAFNPNGNRLKFDSNLGLIANWSNDYKIVEIRRTKTK